MPRKMDLIVYWDIIRMRHTIMPICFSFDHLPGDEGWYFPARAEYPMGQRTVSPGENRPAEDFWGTDARMNFSSLIRFIRKREK